MRFRDKIVMQSIALLSAALAFFGFIVIYSNFTRSLKLESSYSISENALILSDIDEYYLAHNKSLSSTRLVDAYVNAASSTLSDNKSYSSSVMIISGNKILFDSRDELERRTVHTEEPIARLISDMTSGQMKYSISHIDNNYYIHVASFFDKATLGIVTTRPITATYTELQRELRILLITMLTILLVCSVILFLTGSRLVKPLEKLNSLTRQIAGGRYDIKADIHTNDEIEVLSDSFNLMTTTIVSHMDELNVSIKRREQFVSDFTHEIKTPMTAIIGYADTLLNRDLNASQSRLAHEYIYSEGKRLENMSLALLDLLSLRNEAIDIGQNAITEIVSSVSNSVTPVLESAGITLVTDVEPGIVVCNPDLICTAIINLIDNARKASKSGDTIHFTGRMEGNVYKLCVIDHGIGMDERTVSHICDEFYKADKTRNNSSGGYGLGMSLVSEIVSRHRGSLDVESKQGAGSKITITLRLSVDEDVSDDGDKLNVVDNIDVHNDSAKEAGHEEQI